MYLYAGTSSTPKKAGRSKTPSGPVSPPKRHQSKVTSSPARPLPPKVKFPRSNNASPEKKAKVFGSPKPGAKVNSLAKAKSSLDKNLEKVPIIELDVTPQHQIIRPNILHRASAYNKSRLVHQRRRATASDTVTSTQAKPVIVKQDFLPITASKSECSVRAKALIRNYMLDEGFYCDISSEDNWDYVSSSPDRDNCFQTTTIPSDASKNTVLVGNFPSGVNAIEIYVPNVKYQLPTVKVIAEKYSKFKKGGIEIRQLEEKIICIEYDIDETVRKVNNDWEPRRLRTYFSLKPKHKEYPEINENENVSDRESQDIMTMLMNKLNMKESDLRINKHKEIEIIDVNYENNREYLQDLKNLLEKKYILRHNIPKHIINLDHLNNGALSTAGSVNMMTPLTDLESGQKLEALKELIVTRSRSNLKASNKLNIRIPTTEDLDELPGFMKTSTVMSTSLLKKVWRVCQTLEMTSKKGNPSTRKMFTSSSTDGESTD